MKKVLAVTLALIMIFNVAAYTSVSVQAAEPEYRSWQASEGFSTEQGKNQWYYYFNHKDRLREMDATATVNRPESLGSGTEDAWQVSFAPFIQICADWQTAESVYRAWKAETAAKVLITGNPRFLQYDSKNDGLTLQILKNGHSTMGERELQGRRTT